MDSISQGVLGASMWETVWSKRLWNKAVRRGIALGTVPDLDVFVGRIAWRSSFDSSVFHRGITHSIVFCVLAAPAFGRLIARIYHKDARDWKLWSWISFWCFITHSLLDLLTSYGTKMLWPWTSYGWSLDTIAIADPFWTLPFLWFVIRASRLVKTSRLRRVVARIGFGYALAYIGMTFVNKTLINARFESQLTNQWIVYQQLATYPEVLQQMLRRGIAKTSTGYYVEWYTSFLDTKPEISLSLITGNHELLSWYHLTGNNLEVLLTITKGYFMLQQSWSELLLYDLRFGRLIWWDDAYRQDRMFGRRIIWCHTDGWICQIEPYRSSSGRRLSREIWDRFWQRVIGQG